MNIEALNENVHEGSLRRDKCTMRCGSSTVWPH